MYLHMYACTLRYVIPPGAWTESLATLFFIVIKVPYCSCDSLGIGGKHHTSITIDKCIECKKCVHTHAYTATHASTHTHTHARTHTSTNTYTHNTHRYSFDGSHFQENTLLWLHAHQMILDHVPSMLARMFYFKR